MAFLKFTALTDARLLLGVVTALTEARLFPGVARDKRVRYRGNDVDVGGRKACYGSEEVVTWWSCQQKGKDGSDEFDDNVPEMVIMVVHLVMMCPKW